MKSFAKIFKMIFSRLALTFLFILLQIGVVTAGAFYVMINWPISIIGFAAVQVITFFFIINRKGPAELRIPWLIVILLPVLGVMIYFFFANHGLKLRYRRLVKAIRKETAQYFPSDSKDCVSFYKDNVDYVAPFKYLGNSLNYTLSTGNRVTYYGYGEKWFPEFIESLKTAKKFIFMEFFIVDRGKEWTLIHDVLRQKVKEGVDVRVIYDDIGCAGTMHTAYPQVLRKQGIKCYRFNPFIPVLSGLFNNRDHRKIAVIDNKIAYTGGMNLADEYANDIMRFGYWKDAMIKVEGPAIKSLTNLFLNVYDLCQHKISNYEAYLNYDFARYEENAVVAPFGDGPAPFYKQLAGEYNYINLIDCAKKNVYISTPYFIPTESLKSALIRAAYRGIDVRLLLPGIPDKKIPYKIALMQIRDLIEAGVKVYRYNEGFNHQKSMTVDGEIAFVGTINMDYRSLVHHFECGATFSRSPAVKELEKDVLETYSHCDLFTLENTRQSAFTVLILSILNMFVSLF